jgi:hypothetical protein
MTDSGKSDVRCAVREVFDMTAGIVDRLTAWMPPQFGADFDGRFDSREAAKNAKKSKFRRRRDFLQQKRGKAFTSFFLRVLRGFA